MFLVYISELIELLDKISVKVKAFADDVKMYVRIVNDIDCDVLQCALDSPIHYNNGQTYGNYTIPYHTIVLFQATRPIPTTQNKQEDRKSLRLHRKTLKHRKHKTHSKTIKTENEHTYTSTLKEVTFYQSITAHTPPCRVSYPSIIHKSIKTRATHYISK